MAIEKYLEPAVIFDPVPSYFGDWYFELDNLHKNAKIENGVNLFDAFLKKTYDAPIRKILKNIDKIEVPVRMHSLPNENGIGRCLKYSKLDFYVYIIDFMNRSIDRYGKSEEDQKVLINNLLNTFIRFRNKNESLIKTFIRALTSKTTKLKDLIDNEIASEYYDAAMKDYALYKTEFSFSEYLKVYYEMSSDLQNNLVQASEFFDQKIDFKELYAAFEPDTFFLLFAKIIYEISLSKEKKINDLDNSYSFYYKYKNAIDEILKSDPNYNPVILFKNLEGKKEIISLRDLLVDFDELLKRHPDKKIIDLPSLGDDSKYKDINLMQKITSLYNKNSKANWEFLEDGINLKKNFSQLSGSKAQLINDTNMRIRVLENSGFIGKPLKGLKNSLGYYAFIYPNGKVILEKFWNEDDGINPATGSPTYVISLDCFVRIAKTLGVILEEYVKTLDSTEVKRIFHTTFNNWQRNLYNEINETYSLDDVKKIMKDI